MKGGVYRMLTKKETGEKEGGEEGRDKGSP